MSRVLITTWDGAGNLVATLGIAQHLAERGHDVRLLGHRSIDSRVGSHGWRFRSFETAFDWDSTTEFDPADEFPLLGNGLWFSDDVADDVTTELEREPADVLIADCMLFGALSAGQAADVPTVALFHTAYAGFRGGPLVDMLAWGIPTINATRQRYGLTAAASFADVHDQCALALISTPREFEPDLPLPPNARFIGPVLDAPPLTRDLDAIDVPDGPEPLVVVSLSTSYQAQTELLQRVTTALGQLHARIVVTTGNAIDPASLDTPANTRSVRFVPHQRLLSAAALVVTHAGLGTVMTALGHGVPLVCLPMGRDQFFNAARVEQLGAGRVLDSDADATAITNAVRAALADDQIRYGAKRVASLIANYGGAADAAAEIERLLS